MQQKKFWECISYGSSKSQNKTEYFDQNVSFNCFYLIFFVFVCFLFLPLPLKTENIKKEKQSVKSNFKTCFSAKARRALQINQIILLCKNRKNINFLPFVNRTQREHLLFYCFLTKSIVFVLFFHSSVI